VRLALLAGQFPYGKTGLLDETHLRFLTHGSLETLLREAGLAIGELTRIIKAPADPAHFEVPFDPAIVPDSLLDRLSRDPEALTYQFVLSAHSLTDYQQLVQNIRDLVRASVPEGGLVLVLSRGDGELLQLDPCQGSHFPQQEDGTYSGYHPLDGAAAVQDLQQVLKRTTAPFFLIPQTAHWWLVEYRDLADYLNEHATRIIDQHEICIMYRFRREDTA
jgi:hypothetical protein